MVFSCVPTFLVYNKIRKILRNGGVFPMLTPEIILQEAKNLSDYMIAIRRDIHAHPELGRDEYRTQALVIRELEAMGIEARPIADTGGLGLLRGGKPGKTRSDACTQACHQINEQFYQKILHLHP